MKALAENLVRGKQAGRPVHGSSMQGLLWLVCLARRTLPTSPQDESWQTNVELDLDLTTLKVPDDLIARRPVTMV